jgi:hypothetical protein
VKNHENVFNLLSADILTLIVALEKKKGNPTDIARIEAYYLAMQSLVQDLLKMIKEKEKELSINYTLEAARAKDDIQWIDEYRTLREKALRVMKHYKVPDSKIEKFLTVNPETL